MPQPFKPNYQIVALFFVGVVMAFFWAGVFILGGEIGAGLVLAVPAALGFLIGHSLGLRKGAIVLSCMGLLVILGFGLITLELSGLYCGLIAVVVFLPQMIVAALFGGYARRLSERHYPLVPPVVGLLPLLLAPPLVHAIEATYKAPHAIHTVTTHEVIPVPAVELWERIMFYEDVEADPPWLLRLGLPTPVRTVGQVEQPGDITTCVYDKGYLRKRITAVEPAVLLSFDVIEQVRFESRSIRLVDGRFDFHVMPDGSTLAVLTTRYEPLLSPRWVWQPFEDMSAHALHRHVLKGMRDGTRKRDVPELPHAPWFRSPRLARGNVY